MNRPENLASKVSTIAKFFDISKVLNVPLNPEYVKKYYKINKLAYSIFYSREGLVHVGISKDGIFRKEDLLGPAKIVDQYIKDRNAKAILELATGRGGNSFYLAQNNSDANFYGIDQSKTQLGFAKKKARLVKNYFPVEGDFHELKACADGSIDIVFQVESMCYSTRKEKILSEVHRVLKKNGLFISLDAFANKPALAMTEIEITAKTLAEVGMAVPVTELYDSFLDKAAHAGFKMIHDENILPAVLPSMHKLEKTGKRFFENPYLAKILTKILPDAFLYNAISGYLFPDIFINELAVYMVTVLERAN